MRNVYYVREILRTLEQRKDKHEIAVRKVDTLNIIHVAIHTAAMLHAIATKEV